MRTFAKNALWGVLIAGGVTLLGATTATAAETTGEDGLLSGSQLLAPITAPLKVVGNALGILGTSSVATPAPTVPQEPASEPTPAPSSVPAPAAVTDGNDGAASGTQALVSVTLPIEVSGNAVSILGTSSAQSPAPGEAAAPAPAPTAAPAPVPAPASASASASAPQASTSGLGGLLSGTQAIADVAIPVTVTGNAVSVLGTSATQGTAGGGAPAPAAESGDVVTSALSGLLGGTQLSLPVRVPITISGNAISVLGDATAEMRTPGVQPGSDPGTDPGTDPGSNPGADPGTGPGTGPGTDPGTDPGTPPHGSGAAASGPVLAATGGTDLIGVGLMAGLLLLAGAGLLLRPRVA